MNPENAKVIAGFLLDTLANEYPTTCKVLKALPQDKLNWRPHEKGRTAGELAWHIAKADVWFLEGIAATAFSMEDEGKPPATVAEIAAWYEKNFQPALEKVKKLSGEQLAKTVEFFGMNFPNVTYLSFCERHTVHHRGQLAAYLRAVGAKVPSIYGGSADEPFAAAAGN
jgi:uncharacterized damage-inducible protein DinB